MSEGPPVDGPRSVWNRALLMRVAVHFHDEQLELDVDEARLVGAWHGPPGLTEDAARGQALDALEHPRDYPPLRQAVVPGDRVVIAWDADAASAGPVVGAVVEVLKSAGVESEAIHVLTARPTPAVAAAGLRREGVSVVVHDADDPDQLAYLATTPQGRRVYLNRLLTDADCVVPVGRLGHDTGHGPRGPWSALFPGLSDPAARADATAAAESAEVGWLLGCRFQVGLVPGTTGLAAVIAGLDEEVRRAGLVADEVAWTYRAGRRAELVVAGVGGTDLDDLAAGLDTAARLVRRGGKIALLSRAVGPLGPSWGLLAGAEDAAARAAALRAARGQPDGAAARNVAHALDWADVYLLSALDDDVAEDLGIIPLGRAEEVRRLVATSDSYHLVSRAEWTRAVVIDDEETPARASS